MDIITHTLLATVCMGGCYLWGRYLAKGEILENVITNMLDRLEVEGFIRTKTGTDGEKTLVSIEDLIRAEKALDKSS